MPGAVDIPLPRLAHGFTCLSFARRPYAAGSFKKSKIFCSSWRRQGRAVLREARNLNKPAKLWDHQNNEWGSQVQQNIVYMYMYIYIYIPPLASVGAIIMNMWGLQHLA